MKRTKSFLNQILILCLICTVIYSCSKTVKTNPQNEVIESTLNEYQPNFKLALIQMLVEGGERANNLARAKKMIKEAAENGADIVLLPEVMDLCWAHPSALTDATTIPDGETCKMLINAAKENKIYVCSGLAEKAGDKVYNSAVLISSEGKMLMHHRKINELDIAHQFYAVGHSLNVCETKFGTIGLMICADAFAVQRVISQTLCYMGADIIISPTAWALPTDYDTVKKPTAREIWYDHYAPVAKKFSLHIALPDGI